MTPSKLRFSLLMFCNTCSRFWQVSVWNDLRGIAKVEMLDCANHGDVPDKCFSLLLEVRALVGNIARRLTFASTRHSCVDSQMVDSLFLEVNAIDRYSDEEQRRRDKSRVKGHEGESLGKIRTSLHAGSPDSRVPSCAVAPRSPARTHCSRRFGCQHGRS